MQVDYYPWEGDKDGEVICWIELKIRQGGFWQKGPEE